MRMPTLGQTMFVCSLTLCFIGPWTDVARIACGQIQASDKTNSDESGLTAYIIQNYIEPCQSTPNRFQTAYEIRHWPHALPSEANFEEGEALVVNNVEVVVSGDSIREERWIPPDEQNQRVSIWDGRLCLFTQGQGHPVVRMNGMGIESAIGGTRGFVFGSPVGFPFCQSVPASLETMLCASSILDWTETPDHAILKFSLPVQGELPMEYAIMWYRSPRPHITAFSTLLQPTSEEEEQIGFRTRETWSYDDWNWELAVQLPFRAVRTVERLADIEGKQQLVVGRSECRRTSFSALGGEPPDPSTFTIPTPIGTRINDTRYRIAFTVGQSEILVDGVVYQTRDPLGDDPGADLAAILSTAIGPDFGNMPPVTSGSNPRNNTTTGNEVWAMLRSNVLRGVGAVMLILAFIGLLRHIIRTHSGMEAK